MRKTRLEAFSDGVLAIIITIMVLEMRPPHNVKSFSDLTPMLPVFMSYVLSFLMVLIYWNNHHHLFRLVQHINGAVMLANGHLLFWLSLVPFVTNMMGESHFGGFPVLLYGIVLLMAGLGYYILELLLIRADGKNSQLAKAVGGDTKGLLSLGMYSAGCILSFFIPLVSCILYASVSVIWLIPDSRIERQIKTEREHE